MEREIDPVWRNAMNFGVIGGGVMALIRLLIVLTSENFFKSSASTLIYLALVFAVVMGTKYYRDKLLNGYVNYKFALRSGFLISFFCGAVYGFYVYLEYEFLKPENFVTFLQLQEEVLRSGLLAKLGIPQEPAIVEEQVSELYDKSNPVRLGITEIFNTALWGSLASLVISIIVKKKEPVSEMIDNKFDQF